MDLGRRCDLHMHTILSDGELLASELARRAEHLDHALIAITDHVDKSNLDVALPGLIGAVRDINTYSEIKVLAGVELTHIPPRTVDELARKCKYIGANVVVVHGETVAEPVKPGTNRAAVNSRYVDILAHPGEISVADASAARDNGVYLEITAKPGHGRTNPHVASVCQEVEAPMLVNTDLHSPDDFISQRDAYELALQSGLSRELALETIRDNPRRILARSKLHFRL